MRHIKRYTLTLYLVLVCFALIGYIIHIHDRETILENKIFAFSKKTEKTNKKLDALKDAEIKHDSIYFDRQAIAETKQDSSEKKGAAPNAISYLDTVKKCIEYSLSLKTKDKKIAELEDSLQYLSHIKILLTADNGKLKETTKNLRFIIQDFDGKLSEQNDKEKNFLAKVSFPIVKGKGLRSDRNYVRFENLIDTSFKVNNERYYDHFIPNTENNQFLVQARINKSLSTGMFQVGGGTELKIDRFSGNVGWLWNTAKFNIRNSAVIIGGKFDIFKKRI